MADLKVVSLAQLTADGSTPGVQVSGSMRNPSGAVNVRSHGSFGGGTLSYEGSLDNAVWYSLGANATFTEAGGSELSLIKGEYIRATIAGSTTPVVDTDIILPGTDN